MFIFVVSLSVNSSIKTASVICRLGLVVSPIPCFNILTLTWNSLPALYNCECPMGIFLIFSNHRNVGLLVHTHYYPSVFNSMHSNWYTHPLVLQSNPDSNFNITQSILPFDCLPNRSLLCNSLCMLHSTFSTTFILTLFLSKHICISFLILEYKIVVTPFLHIYYFKGSIFISF